MDDPPALPVLEYGRPPPSPWRGNVLRTFVVFGLAIVLFGCCILGGYLGHLASPRPNYTWTRYLDLPYGTTPETSPVLATSLAEIQRPKVVAETLQSHGLASGEDQVGLSTRMSLSTQFTERESPKIRLDFRDKDSAHAARSGDALAYRLAEMLIAGGQNARLVENSTYAEKEDDPMEVCFIGGGVLLAVSIPGLILWRFRKHLAPVNAVQSQSWQDHGQPG